MKWWRVLPMALIVAVTPVVSHALTSGVCDIDDPAQCTVSFDVVGNVLTIDIENTSDVANGGFLTALAFDLGAPATADIQALSFLSTDAAFTLVPAPPSFGAIAPGISVSPDGEREFVITATPGTQPWLGGGSPDGGLAPGESATFTIDLSGAVTEASFFGDDGALVRARGFSDDGSDKDHVNPVPEPATLLLVGTGLVGAGAWRRRKRNGKTA